jgi:GDP-4-dehydro-6-deoxy-D-mannose reductase
MENVLITGADGFVAAHLIKELQRKSGIGLKESPSCTGTIDYLVLDLTDYEAIKELLQEKRPDSIFHLAALPSVALSWEDPWSTYRVNVLGQVNLMEAMRRLDLSSSVHIACSSEEYGKAAPETMPIPESLPFNPCSHYAVSKVAQEVLGLMYHQAFDWRVIVTRGFNHTGPGQAPDFVVSSFAHQPAGAGHHGRQPRGQARFHGRARHREGVPDHHGKREGRGLVQRLQRAGARYLGVARPAAGDVRHGHTCRARRLQAEAQRHPAAAGRQHPPAP